MVMLHLHKEVLSNLNKEVLSHLLKEDPNHLNNKTIIKDHLPHHRMELKVHLRMEHLLHKIVQTHHHLHLKMDLKYLQRMEHSPHKIILRYHHLRTATRFLLLKMALNQTAMELKLHLKMELNLLLLLLRTVLNHPHKIKLSHQRMVLSLSKTALSPLLLKMDQLYLLLL
jgi:hypothetical protein